MFKNTWNSPHFLRRAASHSTKPARNGRVDVRPPEALEQVYDIAVQIADGKKRLEELRAERSDVEAALHHARGIDLMRDRLESGKRTNPQVSRLEARLETLKSEVRRAAHHVGELNALVSGRREMSFEGAFVAVARYELEPSTFKRLSDLATAIEATARRAK